jgi:DNA-binding response OmpR family regulator
MSGRHVLVVDDDPQILELAERALTAAGFRVSTARRVVVARDVLARHKIDLVIADARLPGESGLDLAETTRALGIATMIMSGDHEWLADRGVTRGAYLAKPFSLEHLVELARLCISEGEPESAPPAPVLRK